MSSGFQKEATYSKLANGTWGIRVRGTVTVGEKITVLKRSGARKTETVRAVVKKADGITICTISTAAPPTGTSRSTAQVCGECGRGGRLVRDLEDGILKHFNCCDIPPDGC